MAAAEIDLGKLPFDIDFHPSDNLVAAGLITGDLLLNRYNTDSQAQKLLEVNVHSESCRTVRFINEGRDCSIPATDIETGSEIVRLENSHGAAVNLTESTIASGDDEGCIKATSFTIVESSNSFKVWDTRQCSCSHSFNTHEEYISDITFAPDSMKLLATRKVIWGTQSGTLLLYSWGFFKDCSDRFVDLSPNSIDALLKLDEDRVITGCENGLISLVGILPNKIIQPIGEHSEYPVERLAFSHDRKYLGSASHDHLLKLWDLNELVQDSEDVAKNDSTAEDSDNDGMDVDDDVPKSSKGSKKKNVNKGQDPGSSNNFFAEL